MKECSDRQKLLAQFCCELQAGNERLHVYGTTVRSYTMRRTAHHIHRVTVLINTRSTRPLHIHGGCRYLYGFYVYIYCCDTSIDVSIQHCKLALAGYGSVAFIGCKQCICVGGPETSRIRVSSVWAFSIAFSDTISRLCCASLWQLVLA